MKYLIWGYHVSIYRQITDIDSPYTYDNWILVKKSKSDWIQTPFKTLLKNNSMATSALHTGQYAIHLDKHKAASQGLYYLSDRDRKEGIGSAFCYPVIIKVCDKQLYYIISLVTYGKYFTEDISKFGKIEEVLVDFSKRIELELTLHAIQVWNDQARNN